MREIKFRAWHRHYKKMSEPMTLLDIQDASYRSDHEHIDWLQFTGLKDKNGREIYEGDIVKWDDCSNGEYWRVAEVVVNRGLTLGFKCFDCPAVPNSSAHGHTFQYGTFIYTDTESYLEVIGNIHENPELISGEQNDRKGG